MSASDEKRNLEFSEHAWNNVFAKPNPKEWIKLYAKDTVIYEFGTPEERVIEGRDALLEWMNQLHSGIPGARYKPVILYGSGKYVTIMWKWTGSLENDFLGIKATGQNLDMTGMTIWEFNDEGLVKSERVLWNFFTLLTQLGVAPPPPSLT